MQKQSGRKVVVVLSDGVDRGSRMTLAQAIESAQRADVLVYSIIFSSKTESENNAGGWGRGGGMGGGRRGGRFPSPQQTRPDGKKTMERISKETGGRMFEISKKLTADQIYVQIEEDLLNQYSLTYIPDRTTDSSEYHKIQLTVKDKASVVQTREGYYSSKQPDVKQN
jgi:VWFA-related protein